MNFSQNPEFDAHEHVHRVDDPASGLLALIAIHSTALGPAAGGCRRCIYANERDALTDALRLSRTMTYKNAMAGLPFRGGRSVILANPLHPRNNSMFPACGRYVTEAEQLPPQLVADEMAQKVVARASRRCV